MKRYDRCALILEPAGSTLACGLVDPSVEPLTAKDPEEAVLLAEEHGDRIAALVVPGTLPLETLDLALERLTPRLEIGRGAVLVVAPPRVRAHLAGLRERGVSWAVWEPFDAAELRFAVTAALSSEDALEPRKGLRVPIRLPAHVLVEEREREGEIVNLSMGGAYVAQSDPPELDTLVTIRFPIGERMLETQARVAHRQPEPQPGHAVPEAGMGLAFGGLGASDERLLDGFVRERVSSFRL
ncbi:MAG: PilZ domain-containing protein [Myxococcota bacterium]